jgi:F420H(2)-dependent quinone reductase
VPDEPDERDHDAEPELPQSGPYKVLWDWYVHVPNVRHVERTMVRRTGFSPMVFLWMKSSGNVAKKALLLETIGRRSGQVREVVLPYWQVGADYVVLGTLGGAPTDPQWVRNLRVQPDCAAWISRKRAPMTGRIAGDKERERLAGAGVWHTWLDNYRWNARRHGREVPFVVLSPRATT